MKAIIVAQEGIMRDVRLVVATAVLTAIAVVSLASGATVVALTMYDEPVWIVRDSGSVFGTRRHTDAEAQWRMLAGGVMQWGDGQEVFASFRPAQQPDGTVLFEFDTTAPYDAVGIVLNDRHGGSISLISRNCQLVITDDRAGKQLAVMGAVCE